MRQVREVLRLRRKFAATNHSRREHPASRARAICRSYTGTTESSTGGLPLGIDGRDQRGKAAQADGQRLPLKTWSKPVRDDPF